MVTSVTMQPGTGLPADELTDIGRLSRLILTVIALGAGIAVSICLLRIGLDTRAWPPFCALIVLVFILTVPVAVLSKLRIDPAARTALLGPAIALALIVMLGLSLLGVIGLVIICLGAAIGLFRLLTLQRLAPVHEFWSGLTGFLVLLFAYVIVLAGTRYASFIADFLAVAGRASADVYFHWSIANALRFFDRVAIGINGLTDITYYPLSHILAERVAALADTDTGFGFIANRAVIIAPLSIAAFSLAALAFDQERKLHPVTITCLIGLGILFQNAFVGSSFDSESHILGIAFLGLVLPALRYAMRPMASVRVGAGVWLGLLLCLGCATVSKVTTGFIILALIGYVALRSTYRRPVVLAGLWLAALAVAYLLYRRVVPANAISDQFGSIAGNFGLDEGWSTPVKYYGVSVIALIVLALSTRRDGGFWLTLRRGQLPVAELLLLTIVAATVPCLLLPIFAGAYYMIDPQMWVALPIAVVLGYPLLCRGIVGLWQRPAAKGIAVALLALVFSGFVLVQFGGLLRLRVAQAVAQETLIRTGDSSFYRDRKKNTVLKDLRRSAPYLNRADYYWPSSLNLPAANIVRDLRALRTQQGNDLVAYISPRAQDYWSLSENCFAKSMLVFAAAAVPVIDGLPPLSTQCDQQQVFSYGFILAGKRESDDPLNDDDVCRLALAQGFRSVARINSLAGVDHLVQCKSN
jgi:hypothetical protein